MRRLLMLLRMAACVYIKVYDKDMYLRIADRALIITSDKGLATSLYRVAYRDAPDRTYFHMGTKYLEITHNGGVILTHKPTTPVELILGEHGFFHINVHGTNKCLYNEGINFKVGDCSNLDTRGAYELIPHLDPAMSHRKYSFMLAGLKDVAFNNPIDPLAGDLRGVPYKELMQVLTPYLDRFKGDENEQLDLPDDINYNRLFRIHPALSGDGVPG